MIPILPREMLWTELETMDQFFELDPVNKDFCEVLMTLHEKPFDVKSDDVKVFNELYYQITRMMYECPTPRDLTNYISDIRGNMGWNYCVELVMSMLFFMISLIERKKQKVNRFFILSIAEHFYKCSYWPHFQECYDNIRKTKRMSYGFNPLPVSPKELADKYVHWQEITNVYDLGTMLKILTLWDDENDRRIIVEMIRSSVNFSTPKLQQTYLNQVDSILNTILFKKNIRFKEDSGLEKRINELDSKLLLLQRENAVFQNLNSTLQADNERLKAQLEKKKIDGRARKFTLVEIANYCKGCVDWNDVRSIVAMLNKIMRGICTKEDSELIDSIEEEFRNRHLGDTYIKEQTVFPNVSNYQPQIQNQNVSIPMSGIGYEKQKQIEKSKELIQSESEPR